MTSPLRVLARRSLAPWMVAVYLAVTVALTMTRDTWMFNAFAAVNWVTGSLLMTLPLAIGAAAYDGYRFTRGDWRLTLLPTLRPTRGLGSLAVLHAASVGGAWLLSCAVAFAVSVGHGATPQVSTTMLAHPLMLCMFVSALGVTLGALLPRPWIAPAASAGFFALTLVAENRGPYQRFLVSLGFSGWTPYTQLDPTLVWLKCAALALLALACVVAWGTLGLPRAMRGVRSGLATGLAVGSLVLVAVTAAMQPPSSNGILQADWDGELRCSGDTVTFCTNEPAQLAGPFSAAVVAAFAVLEPYGVKAPATYVDERAISSGRPAVGLWAVDPLYLVEGKPEPDSTALTVSRPAACDAYFSSDPTDADVALMEASGLLFDVVYILLQSERDGSDAQSTWADWHPSVTWESAVSALPQLYAGVSACDAALLPAQLP